MYPIFVDGAAFNNICMESVVQIIDTSISTSSNVYDCCH